MAPDRQQERYPADSVRPRLDPGQRALRLGQLGPGEGTLVQLLVLGLEADGVVAAVLRGRVVLVRLGQRPFQGGDTLLERRPLGLDASLDVSDARGREHGTTVISRGPAFSDCPAHSSGMPPRVAAKRCGGRTSAKR